MLGACADGPDGDTVRAERWASLTGQCPALAGTYALTHRDRPLSQTVLGDLAVSGGARFPWETMTLAGDADDSLVVTLARSEAQRERFRAALFEKGAYYADQYRRLQRPDVRWSSGFATMTDSAYEQNLFKQFLEPVRRRTLHRGYEYSCNGGWLRVDRVVRDPGPDRDNPRPDTVIGVVHLRRGEAGSLVARADYKDEKELMLWCGDGCRGVKLGRWHVRQWGRWPGASAPANGVPERPWAEPFEPPPVRWSARTSTTAPAVIADALRPLLPVGVELHSVAPDGQGFRAVLVSRSTTPFTELLATLRGAYRFRHQQVVGLAHAPEGGWQLTLDLGDIWTDSPANPRDPTRALHEALPSGVSMVGVRTDRRGAEVTLVAQEQARIDAAVRAITSLDAYDEVRVKSSIRSPVDQAIVTVVVVRERGRE